MNYEKCRCLMVNMSVKESGTTKNVHFGDFSIVDQDWDNYYAKNIEGELALAPLDAFLLLANICATRNSDIIFQSYEKRGKEFYRDYLKQDLRQYFENEFLINPNRVFTEPSIASFCVDYYEYLEKELVRGTITLQQILNLSGPHVICNLSLFSRKPEKINEFIDNISQEIINDYDYLLKTQKITYCTLYSTAVESNLDSNFSDFKLKKKSIIKKFLHDFTKEFSSYDTGLKLKKIDLMEKYSLDF